MLFIVKNCWIKKELTTPAKQNDTNLCSSSANLTAKMAVLVTVQVANQVQKKNSIQIRPSSAALKIPDLRVFSTFS